MEKERKIREFLEEWREVVKSIAAREENIRVWLDEQRIKNEALTGGVVQNYAIEAIRRDFFEPFLRITESAKLMSRHFQQLEKLRRGLEGKIEKK